MKRGDYSKDLAENGRILKCILKQIRCKFIDCIQLVGSCENGKDLSDPT
jgi:hypothetical protein